MQLMTLMIAGGERHHIMLCGIEFYCVVLRDVISSPPPLLRLDTAVCPPSMPLGGCFRFGWRFVWVLMRMMRLRRVFVRGRRSFGGVRVVSNWLWILEHIL